MSDLSNALLQILMQSDMGGYSPEQVPYSQPFDNNNVMADYMRYRQKMYGGRSAVSGALAGVSGLATSLAPNPATAGLTVLMGLDSLNAMQNKDRMKRGEQMWGNAPYKDPGPMY